MLRTVTGGCPGSALPLIKLRLGRRPPFYDDAPDGGFTAVDVCRPKMASRTGSGIAQCASGGRDGEGHTMSELNDQRPAGDGFGWLGWLLPQLRPVPVACSGAASGRADRPVHRAGRRAGDCRQRDTPGFPGLPHRPRHGAGLQLGAGAGAGRRHADAVVPAEGQEVKQGDLIAVIDPGPTRPRWTRRWQSSGQDQANLVNARLDLARYTSLARQDFASRQQVDTQVAMVNQLLAAIAGDDAAIESASSTSASATSPRRSMAGSGCAMVDPGNLVHATDATGIVTITQIQPIAVMFTLPQDDLPQSQAAMAAGQAAGAAYASDDKTELDTGELADHRQHDRQTTGTIKLKATFPNADQQLWPGQFVNVRVCSSAQHGVLTVPSAAVQHGPDGLYVYMVKPDRPWPRSGRDGARQRHRGGGLRRAGGRPVVVTDGQSRLQNGSHVTRSRRRPRSAADRGGIISTDEHLDPLHPPTGRHLAVDGGVRAGRHGRLSAAAGGAAAAGRFSDHQRERQIPRRQPGNDGDHGGAAAGAAVRADPRHRRR